MCDTMTDIGVYGFVEKKKVILNILLNFYIHFWVKQIGAVFSILSM